MNTVYLNEINRNLPRLLSLFDMDPTSSSYGMGDRFHWAWGLIDFNNVAFQGAVNGLSRLWTNGLWPYSTEPQDFINRLDALFVATVNSTYKNGSLSQAFPREGSYALTAFVAFDLLCCIDNMTDCTDTPLREKWTAAVAPLITFLIHCDETHGFISNHIAGAAAALVRWHRLTNDSSAIKKARELISKIIAKQSSEGWFLEYEGADPGYQTLCSYYLADIHLKREDFALAEPLRKSVQFLWHFAHPDGSFGGLYGSRCTRFYYPAGILALAQEFPEAAALADFMEQSISRHSVVTLSAVDEPNLVPFFNAYCWAAALEKPQKPSPNDVFLPALRWRNQRTYFSEAGLMIDASENHYTVISTCKGGVIAHFKKSGGTLIDGGVVVQHKNGQLGSSQNYSEDNQVELVNGCLHVTADITKMPKKSPNAFQFLVLRILSLTLFRSHHLREWVKQLLVKLLITKKTRWKAQNKRCIQLGANLSFVDETTIPAGFKILKGVHKFVPIHMASQAYWQIQDEQQD